MKTGEWHWNRVIHTVFECSTWWEVCLFSSLFSLVYINKQRHWKCEANSDSSWWDGVNSFANLFIKCWPMSKIFSSIFYETWICWAKRLINTWRLREKPISEGLIFEEVYDSIALCQLCLHICLTFFFCSVLLPSSLARSFAPFQSNKSSSARLLNTNNWSHLYFNLGSIVAVCYHAMPFMLLITIVFVWSVVCSFVHIQHNPLQRTQNKWHKV